MKAAVKGNHPIGDFLTAHKNVRSDNGTSPTPEDVRIVKALAKRHKTPHEDGSSILCREDGVYSTRM